MVRLGRHEKCLGRPSSLGFVSEQSFEWAGRAVGTVASSTISGHALGDPHVCAQMSPGVCPVVPLLALLRASTCRAPGTALLPQAGGGSEVMT